MKDAKQVICAFGRYEVIKERVVSDYHGWVSSVRFLSDDGATVILACVSQERAEQIAKLLQGGVIDVSLRDTEEIR